MGEKPWEKNWSNKRPWERDWTQQPVATTAPESTDGTLPNDEMVELVTDGGVITVPKKLADEQAHQVGGFTNQALNGATFGAAPRLRAAAETGFGLTGNYDETLKRINDEDEQYATENPGMAVAGQLIGGAAVPGVLTGRAYAATRAGVRAAGYGSKTARVAGAAAAGAPTGATYGVLSSDDLTDIPQDLVEGAKGAAAGAIAGPVLGGLWSGAKLGGRVARDLAERATGMGSQRWATQKAANVFEGRSISPAHGQSWERDVRRDEGDLDAARAAAAVYDHANNRYVPNALVGVDEALAAEAEFAAKARSTSAAPYTNFAEQTVQHQGQRVADNVPHILTNGQGVGFRQFMNHIDDDATVNRDAFYNAMRSGQVGNASAPGAPLQMGHIPTAGLPAMIQRVPATQQILNDAIDAAIARGVPYVNRNALRSNPSTLPPYVVDLMYRATSSADNDLLRGIHDRLRRELRTTPQGQWYLDNKEIHHNAFSSQTGAQRGRDIWGTSGASRQEALREIERMRNPAARADARTAAAGALQHHLEVDNGSFARPANIVDRPENVSTMRELFGPAATTRAEDYIQRERNLNEVADRMVNAAAGSKHRDPNLLENLLRFKTKLTFTPSVALQDAAANMASGYTKKRTAELARQLLSLDPADYNAVRAELERRSNIINNGRASDQVLAALAAVSSGTAQ